MRHHLAVAGSSLLILLSFAPPNPSAEVDPVNRAIDRGVAALKKAVKGGQREENLSNSSARGYTRFASGDLQVGVTALATLTLVECGAPAEDPAVEKRLPTLRLASIKATHTYTLALLILLFDRVGDADDVPLIHSMALRLLAGQYYADGWSYYCPAALPEEIKKLTKLVKERPPDGPREKKMDPKDQKAAPLPGDVQEQLKQLVKRRRDVTPNAENFQGRGDNSNTQFAVLGLWTARRYGIPIGPALAAAETRFRKSQGADGGWGYVPSARGEATKDTGTTPSMTCAGLMVLGMSYALAAETALDANPKAEVPDLARDPSVRAGFAYLAGGVGQPLGLKGRKMAGFTQTGYYYLWSLERVGVGYNLRVIGNKDWYAWGAATLVASQEADGFWQHEYGYVVDTCFALLFLKRVNLFKDATDYLSKIEGLGAVGSSPGEKK